jgi:two-component system sensor histidine kinase HydH
VEVNILDKIAAGLTAWEVIVSDVLQFTSRRDPSWQVFRLEPLVREVCDAIAPQLAAQGVHAELDLPPQLTVLADRDMLRRATRNLVLNALDAMPQGGELAVTGTAGPHGIELEIADSGPGIRDEDGPRLFEPFFTTKSGGAGWGLAIVQRIAAAHGGDVSVRNCPQGGAAFTIRLPYRSTEAAA